MAKRPSKFRDRVRENSHRQKTQGTQYGYLNLPKGVPIFKENTEERVKVDFLPYKVTASKHPDRDEEIGIAIPGELWYKRPFKVHHNIGGDSDTVVCPASMGEKCPICLYITKRYKEGADRDELKPIRASVRNLYVIIPLEMKKYEERPHIWNISQFAFQDKLNEEISENEDFGIFPDLSEGLTVKIRFAEQKIGKNSFFETSRIDFLERKEQYNDNIIDEMPNLDEVLISMGYQELERKFFEVGDEITTAREEKEKEKEKEKEEERYAGEEEKEIDVKPIRRLKQAKKETPFLKENKCPHKHQFGPDCDEYDECDKCDMWDLCVDADNS